MVEYPIFNVHFAAATPNKPLFKSNGSGSTRARCTTSSAISPIAGLHPLAYRSTKPPAASPLPTLTPSGRPTTCSSPRRNAFRCNPRRLWTEPFAALAEAGLPDVAACLQNGEFAAVVQAGVAEGQGTRCARHAVIFRRRQFVCRRTTIHCF